MRFHGNVPIVEQDFFFLNKNATDYYIHFTNREKFICLVYISLNLKNETNRKKFDSIRRILLQSIVN